MISGILARNQHNNVKLVWLAALIVFVVSTLMPNNVLAFEAKLPLAVTPKFVAQTHLAGTARTKLDPYLAKAINGLPDYQYMQSGSALGASSPITEKGNWPAAPVKVKKVAYNVPKGPLPTSGNLLVMEGQASFYSREGCLGCNPLRIMANGQPLNDNALTMAIGADKVHLVGHRARVTSLATGKSVEVLITDTGGFYRDKYGNRVADLTIATKQAIGMNGGLGQVRVEVF
ncbi:MAG: septal ring lytic transglycosylase RlpA family protein [bacterium]|nr:septal ring lytic transglycosylase RlpA family protein [bacterium]